MDKPKIYADFHNADPQGRVRLNCIGTTEDLTRLKVTLREGLAVTLYADDADAQGRPDELIADGVVAYSQEDKCWVAAIDWKAVRHASDSANIPASSNPSLPLHPTQEHR